MARQAYRSDIDGLRAIAVVSVVLFHLNSRTIPNGFLGVDVFFVISGYLISGILWREISAKRFSLLNFYERRIRRLMPALVVMLGVVALFSVALLLPSDLAGFGKSLLASLAFVANIYFWRDTHYFAAEADLKPLLNIWSLGVEEQFYIFFPLLLWGLFRFSRALLPVAWLLVLGSLGLNIFLLKIDGASPAFYLLPTRAWELGAGVIIALSPGFRASKYPAIGLRGLAWVLIVAGFASSHWLPASLPMSLPVALPVVVGTALLIWVGAPSDTLSGKCLAASPVNFMGKISYSLYLWHWPVIVLLKYYLIRELTAADMVLAGLISLVLAVISWRYVEQPFRGSRTPFLRVALFSGVSVSILACAGLLLVFSNGLPGRQPAEVASISRSIGTHYRCPVSRLRPFGASRACDLTLNGRPLEDTRIAVLGNSHAQMYAPLVRDFMSEKNVPAALFPLNGCLPTLTVNLSDSCRSAAEANLAAVLSLPDVDTVIVAFNWPYNAWLVDAQGAGIRTDRVGALVDGVNDLLDRLGGKRVILVGPIDTPNFDITSVLSRQISYGVSPRVSPMRESADFYERFQTLFDVFESRPGLIFIRPDKVQCHDGVCDFIRGDLALFADSNHLSRRALPLFAGIWRDAMEQVIMDDQPAAPE